MEDLSQSDHIAVKQIKCDLKNLNGFGLRCITFLQFILKGTQISTLLRLHHSLDLLPFTVSLTFSSTCSQFRSEKIQSRLERLRENKDKVEKENVIQKILIFL